MNAAAFFMENFGRHFIQPTGDDWADVREVLRRPYPMNGKESSSRMQSGWAIVRPGSATLMLDLNIPVILKSRMSGNEAFAAELAAWDGREPRIFILFDKSTIAAQNIFLSVDKRRVRICTKSGAETRDWTAHPPTVKGEAK